MAQSSLVAVGTYTRTTSDGIYVCEFDGETGELDPVSSIAGAENPSFLALHPNGGRCTRPLRSRTLRGSGRARCTRTTSTRTRVVCR